MYGNMGRPALQVNTTIFDIMDLFIVFAKQTMHKQVPFMDRIRYEKEIRQLQIQLNDKSEQLEAREAKISELEHLIRNIEGPLPPFNRLTNETPYSPYDLHAFQEQAEAIRRLSEELATREQEKTHLDSLATTLRNELEQLQSKTQATERENGQLRNRVGELEGYLTVSMRDFDFLCDENGHLRERLISLEKEKAQAQNQLAELEAAAMKFDEMKSQHQTLMRERCSMQTEDALVLKEREEKLREEVQLQGGQLERAKQALNNYDWKLFCLETELDLWAKECKHLKSVNENVSTRLAETELLLRQKQSKMFQEREENRLLNQENTYLAEELQKSEAKVGELTAKTNTLLDKLEEHEEDKLETYRLREKEEQLSEIMTYLKQKIGELDEVKQQVSSLERRLQAEKQKNDGLMRENQQLEKIIVSEQEGLSKKVNQLQLSLETARKEIEDNTILDILREGEWIKLKQELEESLAQKTQTVSSLTAQLAHTQVAHRQLEEQKKALEFASERMLQLEGQLQQAQKELTELRTHNQDLATALQNTSDEVQRRSSQLKVSREEVVSLLKQIEHYNSIQFKLEGKLEELQEQADELHKKLGEQKRQLFQQKLEIDLVTKENAHYKILNSKLRDNNRKKDEYILDVRTEATRLLEVTRTRIHQMHELLAQPVHELSQAEPKEEETAQFEILDDDAERQQGQEDRRKEEFELMEWRLQRRHGELKEIVDAYWAEVSGIAKRFEL